MAISVKLSDQIVSDAKKVSGVMNRSVAGQIEFWAKIGKILTENPDLTYEFVQEIFLAQKDIETGDVEFYTFDE